MHPDYKMGLAVGLALVGLVGAMFFRKEHPSDDSEPPPLLNVAELDEEVSGSPRAPYINGIDDLSEDNSSGRARSRTAKKPITDPEAALDKAEEQATLAVPEPVEPSGDNDPMRAGRRSTPAHVEIPEHNREWQPTRSRTVGGVTAARNPLTETDKSATNSQKGSRSHTIQAGDTLSRIAEQHLGSPKYYREIYNANRDKLRSVDDLPEGVALIIPELAGTKANNSPSTTGRSSTPPRNAASRDEGRTQVIDDDDEDGADDRIRPRRGSSRNEDSKPFKLEFEPVKRRSVPKARTVTNSTASDESGIGFTGIEIDTDSSDDGDDAPLSNQRRR